VSRPVEWGGLGFGYKWNMGWMHDTLNYISKDPIHRRYHHGDILFGLHYAFSENFVLPLSHDEVVHGKRSILGRMPGDDWQRFANLRAYTGGDTSIAAVAQFARREVKGAFTWEEIARYRERWKRPLVLKGILHPDDAERAVSLGVDGIIVSNHGGRQVEALPAAIDALPAIVARVGARTTVMMDSGIRSGADVVRALALGAQSTFAGKAFLWGLGALGSRGPGHVIDLLSDETRAALGQIGARRPADARSVAIRHPGALRF